MIEPLFILALPRSFTSLIGTMLGQHPQAHGLPETHLLHEATMAAWWRRGEQAGFQMMDGLLRAVAQLCFGGQTETTVRAAAGWLRRRAHLDTGFVMEALAEQAGPRALVDKSPSTVYHVSSMRRAQECFPHARFLHLVRHPRDHGESVLKYSSFCAQGGLVPEWLSVLASFPTPLQERSDPEPIDPQRGWYALNMNICQFLDTVPWERQLHIRSEDVLANPETTLRCVAGWLGWRTDAAAIEEMMHPERSPYAGYGPPGAQLGNDLFFLTDPVFRRRAPRQMDVSEPLQWRRDGQGFWPEVVALAQEFGYR